MLSLEELLSEARQQTEARLVATTKIGIGGVDPLGLRQINFDLMDQVLPDLNNVARHIRPYIVMAWAWRRVRMIVQSTKLKGAEDEQMRDFVDRIEAIYAWSQFLNHPQSDLPGRQAMQELMTTPKYVFGGAAWEARRDMRRESTGIISPLNYGPSLRTLGWLLPVEAAVGVFQPDPDLEPVLDQFEDAIRAELSHEAFNKFGPVTVSREDASRWGALWSLDNVTDAEREIMFSRLGGDRASKVRRKGIALLAAAHQDLAMTEPTADALRARMADLSAAWRDPKLRPEISDQWRELQVRQLFRLTLEGLFHWTVGKLIKGPMTTHQIARAFLEELNAGTDLPKSAEEWVLASKLVGNPVAFLRNLETELQRRPRDPSLLATALLRGLTFSLAEAPTDAHRFESVDRLPLSRARRDTDTWRHLAPREFLVRLIENWIMAQHAYWSVGRGLADARTRGKQIMRLRIVMDEGGWTLTPGTTTHGNPPQPTPDRLETAISLLTECHRFRKA
ncbi:hypothetical protein [Paracoccus yeei]|uniref:hypothetical protein n=1 Tax=Paracoccus yeei TaxID=147645 RepID=UPI00055F0D00|nr:hypothetical protein [Paracoccus yeei]OWJ90043.1 septum formation inhibitor-activating ATPase [Paracoccus yeei]